MSEPDALAAPRRTVIPSRTPTPAAERRQLHRVTFEAGFDLVGALAAACAVATLLFGWIAPLTGVVGWVVVTFLLFLGIYALLTSLRGDRQEIVDRLATVLLASAGIVLFAALVFVVVYVLGRGNEALVFHPNFLTQTMELAGPLDPLTEGGILHAIVGSLIQLSIALAVTVPLGIATAVFLNEVGGRFARFVRTIVDAMTALPSIVAGLFVYVAIIQLVTHQRSGFAAAMAITVMMLPIVVRAADVVLRLVSSSLREASYALGATRWRTVWNVVLPTARSGLVTAVILGTARGIGETSPVLLTSGVTAVMNLNPFSGPMISMPLQVFDFVKSSEPNVVARGFGTAAVLLVLVLILFAAARIVGGRGPGVLSDRRRRQFAQASARDAARFRVRDAARRPASRNPSAQSTSSSAPSPSAPSSPPEAPA